MGNFLHTFKEQIIPKVYKLYHFSKETEVFDFNTMAQRFSTPNISYCEIITANVKNVYVPVTFLSPLQSAAYLIFKTTV